jgi:soluble lytic murein transglycosylase
LLRILAFLLICNISYASTEYPNEVEKLIQERDYDNVIKCLSEKKKLLTNIQPFEYPHQDLLRFKKFAYSKKVYSKKRKRQVWVRRYKTVKLINTNLNLRNFILGFTHLKKLDLDIAEEYFIKSKEDLPIIEDIISRFLMSIYRLKIENDKLYKESLSVINKYPSNSHFLKKIYIEALINVAQKDFYDGKYNSSLKRIKTILKNRLGTSNKAAVMLLKAQALEAKKRTRQALNVYKDIWTYDFNKEFSKLALNKIKQLRKNKKIIDYNDRLKHAKSVLANRGAHAALNTLQEIRDDIESQLKKVKGKKRRKLNSLLNKALFEIGRSHYLLRNYTTSKDVFNELIAKAYITDKLLYLLAKVYRKIDDYDNSFLTYSKLVSRFPRSSYRAYAYFIMGLTRLEKDDIDGANRYLSTIMKKYKRSSLYDDAHWYLGYTYYKQGNLEKALKYFDLYDDRIDDAPFKHGKALYWSARAYLKQGKKEKAIQKFAQLIEEQPFSYYVWTLLSKFKDNSELNDFFLNKLNQSLYQKAFKEKNSSEEAPKYNFKDPEHYFRGIIFKEMGLYKLASTEFNRLFYQNRGNNKHLLKIAELLHATNGYHRSVYIMIIFHKIKDLIQKFYHHKDRAIFLLYPYVYRSEVQKYSSKFDVDPYLALSIMKAESIFQEDIYSPAGAIGLMQIMPYTGRRLAQILDMKDFTAEKLLEHHTNIKLGIRYLRKLSDELNENSVFIPISYNAGPHKLKMWLEKTKITDIDEFVEEIPYLETRNYVKKVLSYYGAYKYLYENKIVDLPNVIDEKYRMGPFPNKETWDID